MTEFTNLSGFTDWLGVGEGMVPYECPESAHIQGHLPEQHARTLATRTNGVYAHACPLLPQVGMQAYTIASHFCGQVLNG